MIDSLTLLLEVGQVRTRFILGLIQNETEPNTLLIKGLGNKSLTLSTLPVSHGERVAAMVATSSKVAAIAASNEAA